MDKTLKVLIVAGESAPFIKSGGLGDVVGSLPKALRAKGVDVRVVIPRHRAIKNDTMYGVEFVGEFDVHLQWRKQPAKILVKNGDVPVYFIENDYYFGRGGLYGYDDDNDMLDEQEPHFVQTSWYEGINDYNVEKAIEILNN